MAEERIKASDENFCTSCGNTIKTQAETCLNCGVRQKPDPTKLDADTPMLLNGLLGFFGFMGIGHIQTGSVGMGILLLVSGWVLSILAILTFIFLIGFGFAGLYIAIWIWSIFHVKGVVAGRQRT
jgi:TM2 domain-containing membrane protein YozV